MLEHLIGDDLDFDKQVMRIAVGWTIAVITGGVLFVVVSVLFL